MDRRDFIKTGLIAAGAAAVTRIPGLSGALHAAENETDASDKPDLVAVRNGNPVEMFRKGIEALGGMGAFVKSGQTVVVKPNIAWDRKEEEAANTNPALVAEIVRQALAAGASSVTVFDHTCNEAKSCYRSSGIQAAAEKAGAKVLHADRVEHYREQRSEKAVSMKKALIFKEVIDCDVLINVPVLKNHGGAKMTAAMKNFMGLVWDRQYMHRHNLPQCIADSILYRKPDLNVIDAYRVMLANGPRGVSVNDVKLMRYQILSRDIVAADALSAKLISYPLEKVPYIALAEKLGLGVADVSKLKIRRIDL